MAKKVGYEVIAQRPVCVDFLDGRVVSFRPGQRFEATKTNQTVNRLVRTRDLRVLEPFETIPALPVKLGAPRRVQDVLKARAEVEQARLAAQAKQIASRLAPPEIEEAKPKPAPKMPKQPKTMTDFKSRSDSDK